MKPKFSYVVPVFHVSDLEVACAFFEQIGFTREWTWGEPAYYAGLYSASDHVVHLQQKENVPQAAAGLYLQVDGVEAIYAACQAAGLPIAHPLSVQRYGMRDFSITGPDGVYVTFGEEQS